MIGEIVGSYRIVKPLGKGGMGEVFVAEHTLIGRRAAVKVLKPGISDDPELVTRFFNEARAAGLIRHPGLVDVFDFGRDANGNAFLVMELLEGESLSARMSEGALPEELLVGIGRQVAAAVGAAHAHEIVHRDLKPDNLFLVADDDMPLGLRVKVLDFGIAKLTGATNPSGLKTSTQAILGTPVYMSPEQCRGAGAVDHRADVYSLGCILYEMACGRPPFLYRGAGELIAAHLTETAPSPTSMGAKIRPELERLILRALLKPPGDRPQSMQDVMAALDEISAAAGGLSTARRSLARTSSTDAKRVEMADVGNMATITSAGSHAATPADSGTAPSEPVAASATPVAAVEKPSEPAARPAFSTTLGGAASESMRLRTAPSRSGWRAPAAFAAVVAVAGVVWISIKRSPPPVANVAPVAAPVAPVIKPPDPPPPVAVVAAKVKLTLRSSPAGADVIRSADGVRLGTTPFTYEIAPTVGMVDFSLKRDGFETRSVTLAADHDGESSVDLAPQKIAPAAVVNHAHAKDAAGKKKGGADEIVDVYGGAKKDAKRP